MQILADVAARLVIARAMQSRVGKPCAMAFRQSRARNELRTPIQIRTDAANGRFKPQTKVFIHRSVPHPRSVFQTEHGVTPGGGRVIFFRQSASQAWQVTDGLRDREFFSALQKEPQCR